MFDADSCNATLTLPFEDLGLGHLAEQVGNTCLMLKLIKDVTCERATTTEVENFVK